VGGLITALCRRVNLQRKADSYRRMQINRIARSGPTRLFPRKREPRTNPVTFLGPRFRGDER
jgi:hypothetical protein